MIQFVRFLSAALLAVLLSPHAVADDAAKAEKADQPKTIAELTAESERVEGLFNLFRDPKTGDLHMLIKGEQVDQEFIYIISLAASAWADGRQGERPPCQEAGDIASYRTTFF